MGYATFIVTLDSISTITILSMEGVKILRKTKMSFKDALERFRELGEKQSLNYIMGLIER